MKLSSEDRKDLPEKYFGLPDDKKYPLNDEEHVRKAIQFFKYAKPVKKIVLANNINKRAKQLNIRFKISKDNPFYKFADKDIIQEVSVAADANQFNMEEILPYAEVGNEANGIFKNLLSMSVLGDKDMLKLEQIVLTDYIPRLTSIFKKGVDDGKYLINPIKIVNKIMWELYSVFFNFAEYNDGVELSTLYYHTIKDVCDSIRLKIYTKGSCIKDEIELIDDLTNNFECNFYFVTRKLLELQFECYLATTESLGAKDNEWTTNIDSMRQEIVVLLNAMQTGVTQSVIINTPRQFIDCLFQSNHIGLSDTENYLTLTKNEMKNQINIIILNNRLSSSVDFFRQDYTFFLNMVPKEHYAMFDIIDMLSGSCQSDNIKYYNSNYSLYLDSTDLMFLGRVKDNYFETIYPSKDRNGETIYFGVSKRQLFLLGKDSSGDGTVLLIPLYNITDLKSQQAFSINKAVNNEPLPVISIKRITPAPNSLKGVVGPSPLTEGIDIDKDGNMKFQFKPKKSYMDEYSDNHKILAANSKAKNYDGMKTNLAFLFALITSIERDVIYNKETKISSDKRKDAEKARTFAINDFKTYLKEVQKAEPGFDFTTYYEQSQYGKLTINVTRDAIQGVKRIFQTIMMA